MRCLYAAGNASASAHGATSLGAGITLGPVLTFGHLETGHIVSIASADKA